MVKDPPANAGDVRDTGSILGSGRSSGGGNGNPLQYPCQENPVDRGAWRATVHGVAQSRTQLSDLGCMCTPGVRGPVAVHTAILWPHLHPQGTPISFQALPERPGGPQGGSPVGVPLHPCLVLAHGPPASRPTSWRPSPPRAFNTRVSVVSLAASGLGWIVVAPPTGESPGT